MRNYLQFYINGEWVEPGVARVADVINPATEAVSGQISLGSSADVDRAVAAAKDAFESWSQTSVPERLEILKRIQEEYNRRAADLGAAVTEEMGAPAELGNGFHAMLGGGHLQTAIEVLENFQFEELRGQTLVVKEPIGVCGLITPWNWPLNQVAVKVFPALAAGCTIVLKPPQLAPYSAQILAEIIAASGLPAGVFNMVQGRGSEIGTVMSEHPDIDMISFTGSEPVGVEIARNAATTVKRVCQELGGKSAYVVLDDGLLATNVANATASMMTNSGQTCSAGSRLLVPQARLADAIAAAKVAAESVTVGDPNSGVAMGPVVSKSQYNIVQEYIQSGIDDGAELVAGGVGRPEGLETGYYVKPTVFVTDNSTRIAREEIFGPVLCIIPYRDLDDAVSIANDTSFGLAGYVDGEDLSVCQAVARRMRTGAVYINGGFDFHAAFGGYKRSGNGREWGEAGFEEYLEIKSLLGYESAQG
ncbi:MAG: aldehyde dehydrogenase family protein [Halieaceae bacterium]|nr:aldehyde dehydrogenase family protein [Halieaceae bacterium]